MPCTPCIQLQTVHRTAERQRIGEAMGNSVLRASNSILSSSMKVIHSDGSVQGFQRITKAAKLTLDNAQHFVYHTNGLQIVFWVFLFSSTHDQAIFGTLHNRHDLPGIQG